MNIHFNIWDILLIAAVTIMATCIAYIHSPKIKALIITLPIPFTIATLSIGHAVNATNISGLVVLLIYTHGVRILNHRFKIPIVASIVISALVYCLIGSVLAQILPKSSISFWISWIITVSIAILFYLIIPYKEEPGERSPLPMWLKIPLIVIVVLFLVFMKKYLQGFMTVFPMVGVIASFEAKKSLWTMARQIPILMLTMSPMMAVCRIAHDHGFSLGMSLLFGWILFLVLLISITRHNWAKESLKD